MKNKFLEAGKIVNTHGVRGELRIVSWCDSPDFLCQFKTFYIDGAPVNVLASRPHKGSVLAILDGVSSVEAAMRLKGKIVEIDRTGVALPNGRHFLADLMGLEVRHADTGEVMGTITDILTPPTHEVYEVKGGKHTYLIPAVDEFLIETNLEGGYIRVRPIEGMESDV